LKKIIRQYGQFFSFAGGLLSDSVFSVFPQGLYQNKLIQTLRVFRQKNCTGYFFTDSETDYYGNFMESQTNCFCVTEKTAERMHPILQSGSQMPLTRCSGNFCGMKNQNRISVVFYVFLAYLL